MIIKSKYPTTLFGCYTIEYNGENYLRYDFSTSLVNNNTICSKHGVFEQIPNSLIKWYLNIHLNGETNKLKPNLGKIEDIKQIDLLEKEFQKMIRIKKLEKICK